MADISQNLLDSGFTSVVGMVIPWVAERDYSIIWDDESSFSQAGPLPGIPEAQQPGSLAMVSTGDQSADQSLEVQVWHPGYPKRKNGLGVLWHYVVTPTQEYRGWDPPCTIQGWEPLIWSDTNPEVDDPHIITLQDETLLLAYQRASGGDRVLYVRSKTPAGAWGSQVEVTRVDPTVTSQDFYPLLIELRSGDVLLLNWIEAGGLAQIQVWRSTDKGATWTLSQNAALDDPTTGGGPMRGAAGNGQILLIFRANGDQYASDDEGATFSVVSTALLSTNSDVVFLDGKWVAFNIDSSDNDLLKSYSTTSAFVPLDYDSAVTVEDNAAFFHDDLSAWVGDGIIYVMSIFAQIISPLDIASTGAILIHRSIDGGKTYAGMGAGLTGIFTGATTDGGVLWRWGDVASDNADTTPRSFVGTFQAGRSVISHQWASQNANETHSLGLVYLGGSTTLTMPALTGFDRDSKRVCWEYNWLPFDKPEDMDWTRVTTTGTPADTLENGYLKLVCTADDLYYTRTPTGPFVVPVGTVLEGHICRFVLKVESGGSQTAEDCIFRLWLGDGSRDLKVSLRFGTLGFRLYNDNTGLGLGLAAITQDMTVPVEFLFSARVTGATTNEVSVFYRAVDLDDPAREWTEAFVITDTAVNTTASPTISVVEFGNRVSTTTTSHWREIHFALEQTGDHLSQGFTNPTDLFPRPLSGTPTWLYDGTRLNGAGGPGWRGDLHLVNTRYSYAIERILTTIEPSPRRGWRSVGVGAQEIGLILDTDIVKTSTSDAGSDMISFCFFGANWRTATIYGVPTSGADVSLVSLDASESLQNLRWERDGNRVRPSATSGGDTPYVFENEFAGGYFHFSSTKVRKILAHSAGKWSDAEGQAPRFLLEGIDGTEGTSGSAGRIVPKDFGVVINLAGTHYTGFKISIDAQVTADGYIGLGTLVPGRVVITSPIPSAGTTRNTTSGTALSESEDRIEQTTVLAPTRATETISWRDPAWLGAMQADGTPNYFFGYDNANAEPIGSWGDASMTAQGLEALLDGVNAPIVSLPSIPVFISPQTTTINRPADLMLARFVGPVTVTTVDGIGKRNEIVNVGQITLRQIV